MAINNNRQSKDPLISSDEMKENGFDAIQQVSWWGQLLGQNQGRQKIEEIICLLW